MRNILFILLANILFLFSNSPAIASNNPDAHLVEALSEKLITETDKINPNVLKLALRAYLKALDDGLIKKQVLTVIDYSLPSTEKRLFVFDMHRKKLLFHELVAHGKGNGDKYVTHVSDKSGSLASPVGFYVTEDTYFGANGYSLNIKGHDYGFNEHALNRRIVFHGAWYVSPSVIKQRGSLGRSWGCPAVEEKLAKPIIDTIKNKSAVFAYFPDRRWLRSSRFLNA